MLNKNRAQAKKYFLLMLFLPLSFTARSMDDNELLSADIAFAVFAEQKNTHTLEVVFTIAKGYYLYRHGLAFASETGDIVFDQPTIPAGVKIMDEFFGKVETYRDQLKIEIPYSTKTKNINEVEIQIKSRGCADIGVCYPEQLRSFFIPLKTKAETIKTRT